MSVARARAGVRSPALLSLLEAGASAHAVDAFLADNNFPLSEGSLNTFVWRGDADAVAIEHRVVGLPSPLPLRRLRDSDVWFATAQLPRGSRVEYRLLVRHGEAVESRLDPLNPRVAGGPAGEMSVLDADGYVAPSWVAHDPVAPPGQLTEVRLPSRALRRQARVTVYMPARAVPAVRYPLLVVHDGGDFLAHAAFGTVLDNLMHRRLMADAVVAFTHPRDRMREYTASGAHSRFLNTELVPELERTLPLRGDPSGRALLGASLGAVASLAAAVRAPGMYGGLMLESGSFRSSVPDVARTAPPLRRVMHFVAALQMRPPAIPVTQRILQTYGAYEPLVGPNRAMTPTLRRLAGDVRVVEALDGHNWTNWRDRLLDGLGWLLPPEVEEGRMAAEA